MGEPQTKPLLSEPPPILTADDLPAPASVVTSHGSLAQREGTPKVMAAIVTCESDAVVAGTIEAAVTRAADEASEAAAAGSVGAEPARLPEPPGCDFDVPATQPMPAIMLGALLNDDVGNASAQPIGAAEPDVAASADTHAAPADIVDASAVDSSAAASTAPVDATAETHDALPEQAGADAVTHDAIPELRDDEPHSDRVAQQRGLQPIAEPYVRDPAPSRRWFYAFLGSTAACVLITASVVLWARGEVRRSRAASEAKPHELVAMKVVAEPSGPSVEGVEVEAKVLEGSPCSVQVKTNVAGAAVWVDGKRRGVAPAAVPIDCDAQALVEVRHPRYQDFKRNVTPAEGTLEIDARLEREKTKLTIDSDPQGALVTYNGELVGRTPVTTQVNRFEVGTLWFHAPGRASDWRKIVPKEATRTLRISLKPSS